MTTSVPEEAGQDFANQANEIRVLKQQLDGLLEGLRFVDMTAKLGSLVGSAELRHSPVHRWYFYKEGFSPQLPTFLVDSLGCKSDTGTVVDAFGGVGTTALALRAHKGVKSVISVEYSPFAHFVGATKIDSLALDARELRNHLDRISAFECSANDEPAPDLAAFRNAEIFPPDVLRRLMHVRECVKSDLQLPEVERSFFMLGIAAIIEDVSGAMKDGRALRILRGRQRRRQGLLPSRGPLPGDDVYEVVRNQWLAMIEDLELVANHPAGDQAVVRHVRGDARRLGDIVNGEGAELISAESVDLFIYSPPYLNCLDYTEVYKLELWFLQFVKDQLEFRSLREGTLRSHPSIEFPIRPRVENSGRTFTVIDSITHFLVNNLSRAPVGRIHGHYFADMYEVLLEQYRTLKPGGSIACVVANSTFSRRPKQGGNTVELWRIPVYTDVLIARLAEEVGFEDVEIWIARNLQAKNVNAGFARESIVVARKPE